MPTYSYLVAVQLSWLRRVSIHYCCVILIKLFAVASTQRAGFPLWALPELGEEALLLVQTPVNHLILWHPAPHICRQSAHIQLERKRGFVSTLSQPGGKIWLWCFIKTAKQIKYFENSNFCKKKKKIPRLLWFMRVQTLINNFKADTWWYVQIMSKHSSFLLYFWH